MWNIPIICLTKESERCIIIVVGGKTRSVAFVYDARGQFAKRYTKNASDTVTEPPIFEYDSLGRLIRGSEFGGANNLIQRIEQLYDKANRLEQQSWVIDGDSFTESYVYNDPTVGADASVRPQDASVRPKDGSLASVTTAKSDFLESIPSTVAEKLSADLYKAVF